MAKIIYVGGRYTPYNHAVVPVEDRGYQFADGVYEVVCLVKGQLIDMDPHLDRLVYSLRELRIPEPMPMAGLKVVIREIVRRNRMKDGMIYIQITRGVAPRAHPYPKNAKPMLVVYGRPICQEDFMKSKEGGVSLITHPENRWVRPDIKSISLLANVMAKQKALDEGAYDVAYVNSQGYVTESSASNVWIVNKAGQLQTYPTTGEILQGITRKRLIKLAQESEISVLEEPFTVAEMLQAREVFLSGSVAGIIPVVEIDKQLINAGKSGNITLNIAKNYVDFTKHEQPIIVTASNSI